MFGNLFVFIKKNFTSILLIFFFFEKVVLSLKVNLFYVMLFVMKRKGFYFSTTCTTVIFISYFVVDQNLWRLEIIRNVFFCNQFFYDYRSVSHVSCWPLFLILLITVFCGWIYFNNFPINLLASITIDDAFSTTQDGT